MVFLIPDMRALNWAKFYRLWSLIKYVEGFLKGQTTVWKLYERIVWCFRNCLFQHHVGCPTYAFRLPTFGTMITRMHFAGDSGLFCVCVCVHMLVFLKTFFLFDCFWKEQKLQCLMAMEHCAVKLFLKSEFKRLSQLALNKGHPKPNKKAMVCFKTLWKHQFTNRSHLAAGWK